MKASVCDVLLPVVVDELVVGVALPLITIGCPAAAEEAVGMMVRTSTLVVLGNRFTKL